MSERQIWLSVEWISVIMHLPVILRFGDVTISILMSFTSKLLVQLVQKLIGSYILASLLKEVVPEQLVQCVIILITDQLIEAHLI